MEPSFSGVRERMKTKYPSWGELAGAEKVLLVMAFLADEVKVRELGGNNRGQWVEAFQNAAGIGPGDPWCAAALKWAAIAAGAPSPVRPEFNPAAVRGWLLWARDMGKMTTSPKRGTICMHQTSASTGHIGIVVRVVGPLVYSIEGNTSAGAEGSQRDGGGLYRRVRLKRFWSWGFANI